MEIKIRPYEPSDLEACRRLWTELTERHRQIYEDPSIGGENPGEFFDTYLQDPNLRGVWVAETDHKVIGLTGLMVNLFGETDVEPAVVLSDFRSRGVGRKMVDHVIAEARKKKMKRLSARPVARNIEAISFFVRAGFDIVGHIDLSQDLDPDSDIDRKSGLVIHGNSLKF